MDRDRSLAAASRFFILPLLGVLLILDRPI
jgi:hypothetical protein